MISAMIGQTIQNESEGSPSSQKVTMRSMTRPVATANPRSQSPCQRPDAEPSALVSSVVAM